MTLSPEPWHREVLRDAILSCRPWGESRLNLKQNPPGAVSTLAPFPLFPDSFLKTTDERNLSTKCFRDSSSIFQLASSVPDALGRAPQLEAKASLTRSCSTRAGLGQEITQTREAFSQHHLETTAHPSCQRGMPRRHNSRGEE